MPRNQRLYYEYRNDYRRQKTSKFDTEQCEYKSKPTEGQLKSLQCSSVQEMHPTNESYEISWIQKLVNNMDEDKQPHAQATQNDYAGYRNFSRKNSSAQSCLLSQDRQTSTYTAPQRYSANKYSNEKQYTPISKINQRVQAGGGYSYQDYAIAFANRARPNQEDEKNNEQITRKYGKSVDKYRLQRQRPSVYDNYQSEIRQHSVSNKDKSLNQSSQSYGKIKRLTKTSTIPDDKIAKVSENYQTKSYFDIQVKPLTRQRPKLTQQLSMNSNNGRERFLTETQPKINPYSSQRLEIYLRESRKQQFDNSKYNSNSKYESLKYDSASKSNSKRVEKQDLFPRKNSEYLNNWTTEPVSQIQKPSYHQKQNQVLIVNKKVENQPSYYQSKQRERPKSPIVLNENELQSKTSQKQDDLKMNEMAKRLNSVLENINKKSKMLSTHGSIKQVSQPISVNLSTGSKYDSQSTTPVAPQIKLNYPVTRPSQTQYRRQKQEIGPKQTQTLDKNYLRPAARPTQQQEKYLMMKKSLGMSKHVPHEIIFQQSSSSQINSEMSPRTQFVAKQLRVIFEKLDKNGSGQLHKNNCDLQQINDQIKYLFGSVISKIKYKNQRIPFKVFIQECQSIIKDFQFEELKQVLHKAKHDQLKSQPAITQFKFHEKQTQSQRWNNGTHGQSESKHSSQRSQVVKKYDFMQENNKDPHSSQSSKQKVHWAAPQYAPSLINESLNEPQRGHIDKKQRQRSKSRNLSFGHREDICLEVRDQNREKSQMTNEKASSKIYQVEKVPHTQQSTQKENMKTSEPVKEKKDFEKMCQNLNNKLNNYLTTITKKNATGSHHISLEFSELSKHYGDLKH